MRTPLTIAAAQPSCTAKDIRANAVEHADAIRRAHARVVVFPELSLTGYDLDADPVSRDEGALTPILEACAERDTVALVGAPVAGEGGRAHIAMLSITRDGAEVAYRKSFLGRHERGRFSPGDGPVALDVDGWRIGLGICKDTGVDRHVADTAALGVDVYAAGVLHLPEELDEQETRAVTIARACNAYVAFASFAGAAGGGYEQTAGVSSIWSADGTAIARAGVEPGDVARVSLAPVAEPALIEDLRREASADAPAETRALRAAELIRARTGRRWIGLYGVDDHEVKIIAWSGPAPPAHSTFPIEQGLTGAAVRSRATVVSNDVAGDPRYLTNQETTGSELIVPVVVGDAVVGTLDVEDAKTYAFDETDRALFESVATALRGLFV